MTNSAGLPFKKLDAGLESEKQKTYEGFKVLIVDDAATIKAILRSILTSYKLEVFEASDGKQATNVVESNDVIHLIFCDVNMPVMDGLTFLENLRKRNDHKKATPVIIISTESEKNQIERALVAGISGWAIKPVVKGKLTQLLEKVLDPAYEKHTRHSAEKKA